MKFALICPNEPVLDGYRVAQVTEQIFGVGDPTYWMECSDEIVADAWYFKDGVIIQRTDLPPLRNDLQSM